jgi:hypothetical protein
MNKPLVLTYDHLIVGSSLEAFLFSFHTRKPLIYTRNQQPYSFEKIPDFGMGTDKLGLWKKLAYQMSIAGHIPFENKIKIIRLEDKDTLKIITEEDNVYLVKFGYLHIFDDHAFDGLPPHKGATTERQLYVDYFKIKTNWTYSREPLVRSESFIQEVHWEAKFPRHHEMHRKYLVVPSYAESAGEIKPEYLVKIKLAKLLEERSGGEVVLDHECREIVEMGQNIYDDFDNISFVYTDAEHIHRWHNPRFRMDYMKYFRLMMGIKIYDNQQLL